MAKVKIKKAAKAKTSKVIYIWPEYSGDIFDGSSSAYKSLDEIKKQMKEDFCVDDYDGQVIYEVQVLRKLKASAISTVDFKEAA